VSGGPWHIEFERSGGFAGVSFRADVDSSKLPAPEAAELERLADAVDFSRERSEQPGLPDAFQYHLVAEHDHERHELILGESQLDPPLKALVTWLMERARSPKQ
jgi:hypothetical protein